jgi:hypothetical protein
MTPTSFVPNRNTTAGELTRLHIEGETMNDAVDEHHCEGTESECGVYYYKDRREWVLDVPGGVTTFISFCPFCGEKLPEIVA